MLAMGFYHMATILKKTYCLCPLSLAFREGTQKSGNYPSALLQVDHSRIKAGMILSKQYRQNTVRQRKERTKENRVLFDLIWRRSV
jgi:hypothetical protein